MHHDTRLSGANGGRRGAFKRVCGVTIAGVALLSLVAVGSAAASSNPSPRIAAVSTKPVPGRIQPTSVKPRTHLSIAVIGIVNNPFFLQVEAGYTRAAAVLKALSGTKVTWVDAGSAVTTPALGTAIDAQVALGVNAILSDTSDNSLCTYIKYAVKHGVPFAAYNGNVACAQASGALFFHGQDLYAAGVKAGQLMCQATAHLASKTKPGKVGVSTESLSFQALVDRANGFVAGLKRYCPWVTATSPVVDNADPATIQSNVRSFIASTPNLVGVYMTGGNPYVAANTICAAHKQNTVKFIGFDFTTENAAAIRTGCFTAAISQDPFGQAYDSVMYMYNYLVTGKRPATYFIPTKMSIATKANINQEMAAQASGA